MFHTPPFCVCRWRSLVYFTRFCRTLRCIVRFGSLHILRFPPRLPTLQVPFDGCSGSRFDYGLRSRVCCRTWMDRLDGSTTLRTCTAPCYGLPPHTRTLHTRLHAHRCTRAAAAPCTPSPAPRAATPHAHAPRARAFTTHRARFARYRCATCHALRAVTRSLLFLRWLPTYTVFYHTVHAAHVAYYRYRRRTISSYLRTIPRTLLPTGCVLLTVYILGFRHNYRQQLYCPRLRYNAFCLATLFSAWPFHTHYHNH